MSKFGVMTWDDYIPGKTENTEFTEVEASNFTEAGERWLDDNWYYLADGEQLLSVRVAVLDDSGVVHDVSYEADYTPTFYAIVSSSTKVG